MKSQTHFAALVSIAAIYAASGTYAQDAETPTPQIVVCERAPEIIECELAPEIAVCPEPGIFPEDPEICIFPPPFEFEPPTGEPVDVDIHIDPVVEGPTDPVEGPTDTEVTDGGEGQVEENVVVDTGDHGVDNEVNVVDMENFENGVPIEWLRRGVSNEDPSVIFYSMAGGSERGLESNVSAASTPVLENKETPNSLARGLGQDDKAAAVQTQATTAAPKILSEKKEPTALIKKGRVFLR